MSKISHTPPAEQRAIVLGGAILCAALIILVWVVGTFYDPTIQREVEMVATATAVPSGPFDALISALGGK